MIVEPRDSYLGYPGDSYLGGEDYSLTGLSFTVPDYLNGTTLDLYYELIDDRGGSLEASQSLNIVAPQPKVYSTIESEGNITLVKDQDNLAYIQDSQDNYQPLIYFDQHITIDTFGQDWEILAAENIDGINSVIWKFTDSFYANYGGSADSFWLTQHDSQWAYVDSADHGWQGDPSTNQPPDQKFYKTETDFNLDLNDDGNIGAPPKVYSTIESEGNITLVKDQDNLAYIQDSQDNYQPLIYFDQHITIDTFGQDWKILAAENIDGINSVIWKFTDSFYGGADSFWLTQHDSQWAYVDSADHGWQGDPSTNQAPDQKFYKTETDFNLDLNGDGRIGAPPNRAPVLTGQQYTFPTLEGGQEFTIWESDLLAGFSDPDGDYFYINETWTDHGTLTFDYESLTAYLPVSDTQN